MSIMRTVPGGTTQSENEKPLPFAPTFMGVLSRSAATTASTSFCSESGLVTRTVSRTPRDMFRCQFVKVPLTYGKGPAPIGRCTPKRKVS